MATEDDVRRIGSSLPETAMRPALHKEYDGA
jgi:hypothetical protein